MPDWQGDNPFYLLIESPAGGHVIDLDERGWKTRLADLLDERFIYWSLMRKGDGIRDTFGLTAITYLQGGTGERVQYVSRVHNFPRWGLVLRAYGLRKTMPDGKEISFWVFPWGGHANGDEVDAVIQARAKELYSG